MSAVVEAIATADRAVHASRLRVPDHSGRAHHDGGALGVRRPAAIGHRTRESRTRCSSRRSRPAARRPRRPRRSSRPRGPRSARRASAHQHAGARRCSWYAARAGGAGTARPRKRGSLATSRTTLGAPSSTTRPVILTEPVDPGGSRSESLEDTSIRTTSPPGTHPEHRLLQPLLEGERSRARCIARPESDSPSMRSETRPSKRRSAAAHSEGRVEGRVGRHKLRWRLSRHLIPDLRNGRLLFRTPKKGRGRSDTGVSPRLRVDWRWPSLASFAILTAW